MVYSPITELLLGVRGRDHGEGEAMEVQRRIMHYAHLSPICVLFELHFLFTQRPPYPEGIWDKEELRGQRTENNTATEGKDSKEPRNYDEWKYTFGENLEIRKRKKKNVY